MQMRSQTLYSCLIGLVTTLGAGCSKNHETSQNLNQNNSQGLFSREIIVEDRALEIVSESGKPLQARILIGDKVGSPFANNLLTTDSSGKVQVPAAWTTAQPLTIDVPGYVRITQMDQLPGNLKVIMRPQTQTAELELNGNTTGFQTKDNDDRIDFGLVLSTIKKSDIMAFSTSSLVSPKSDTLSIIGYKFDLPSNVALPNQKEKYSFVPVSLNKPKYRSYFTEGGNKTVFLARGHLPFKKAADGAKNKAPIYELVNLISLTGGQIKQVNIGGAQTTMDLNAAEMSFTTKLKYVAPQIESTQVILAVSAAELVDGFLPADVKSVASGEKLDLNAFTEYPTQMRFLSVLKNRNEFDTKAVGADRFSAALQNANMSSNTEFLPLLTDPEVINPQVFQFAVPATKTLNPLGTAILISEAPAAIETEETPEPNLETEGQEEMVIGAAERPPLPLWEIRSTGWINKLALPQFPEQNLRAPGKVEATYLASSGQVQAQSWDEIIQATTHVTHSSKKY